MKSSRRKSRNAKSREGMVLLLVLLILTMTTATATFAMHTTGYEIRAAGTMRTAMRARNLADTLSSALVTAGFVGANTCTTARDVMDRGGWLPPSVAKYGYPAIVENGAEFIGARGMADFGAALNFVDDAVVDDYQLAGVVPPLDASGNPMLHTNARLIFECREIQNPGNTSKKRYRLKATSFGELGYSAEAADETVRGQHEAISISRTLIDVEE